METLRTSMLLLAVCSIALGQAVTVTPSITYQTMHWWSVLPSDGPGPNGKGVMPNDPLWPSYKQQYINQLVNELGINSVQFGTHSGDLENTPVSGWYQKVMGNGSGTYFNPVNDNGDPKTFNCPNQTTALGKGNCPSAFPMAEVAYVLSNWWFGPTGMRQAILNNGRKPYLIILYVGVPTDFSANSAAEYAEQVLAVWLNIYNTYCPHDKSDACMPYAFIPWNEPDYSSPPFPASQIAANLTAAIQRLNANGFYPQVWCCSTNNYGAALDYYSAVSAALGPGVTINTITSHQYYPSSAAQIQAAYTTAKNAGMNMTETEYDSAYFGNLMTAIQNGSSGYLRYTDGGSAAVGSPSSCKFLWVTNDSPYTSNYTLGTEGTSPCSTGEPLYFWPQLMHYVHDGAVVIKSSATNGWNSVAFQGPGNEGYVVVVQSTTPGPQTITVTGLPAGTYQCTVTISQAVLQPCATAQKTISAGETLSTTQTFPTVTQQGLTTGVLTWVTSPQPARPPLCPNEQRPSEPCRQIRH
jgi:hypothetical protein